MSQIKINFDMWKNTQYVEQKFLTDKIYSQRNKSSRYFPLEIISFLGFK